MSSKYSDWQEAEKKPQRPRGKHTKHLRPADEEDEFNYHKLLEVSAVEDEDDLGTDDV